jgi:hypothetical protein
MNIGPKYESYHKLKSEYDEIREWVSHIGNSGYNGEVLKLSPVHASVKLVISGQYHQGSENYRHSSKVLNSLLIDYIHDNFDTIIFDILNKMNVKEEQAKLETKTELEIALEELGK